MAFAVRIPEEVEFVMDAMPVHDRQRVITELFRYASLAGKPRNAPPSQVSLDVGGWRLSLDVDPVRGSLALSELARVPGASVDTGAPRAALLAGWL